MKKGERDRRNYRDEEGVSHSTLSIQATSLKVLKREKGGREAVRVESEGYVCVLRHDERQQGKGNLSKERGGSESPCPHRLYEDERLRKSNTYRLENAILKTSRDEEEQVIGKEDQRIRDGTWAGERKFKKRRKTVNCVKEEQPSIRTRTLLQKTVDFSPSGEKKNEGGQKRNLRKKQIVDRERPLEENSDQKRFVHHFLFRRTRARLKGREDGEDRKEFS